MEIVADEQVNQVVIHGSRSFSFERSPRIRNEVVDVQSDRFVTIDCKFSARYLLRKEKPKETP